MSNSDVTKILMEDILSEAKHQKERWGDQDRHKSALDWFWLIGFLSQKIVYSILSEDKGRAKKHLIETAAVLVSWHSKIVENEEKDNVGAF